MDPGQGGNLSEMEFISRDAVFKPFSNPTNPNPVGSSRLKSLVVSRGRVRVHTYLQLQYRMKCTKRVAKCGVLLL